MADNFPSWYEVVTGPDLHQGDLLPNFPVAVVQSVRNVDDGPNVFIEHRDVIVLTQTCDMPKPAQTSVLLAQIATYQRLLESVGQEARGRSTAKSLSITYCYRTSYCAPSRLSRPWPGLLSASVTCTLPPRRKCSYSRLGCRGACASSVPIGSTCLNRMLDS
jgi:hypothetical protein